MAAVAQLLGKRERRVDVAGGAALLVPDAELDGASFSSALTGLLDEPERRAAMREAARGLGSAQAASALADQVESVAWA